MIRAGGGINEYALKAGQLNASFIGSAFGYNKTSTVLYGRIAGVSIANARVVVWLLGVPGQAGELELSPDEELYFSHSTHDREVETLLEQIEKNTNPGGMRR